MAQSEKQLTEQLKAVENDIEGIDVQIASDPPETSDSTTSVACSSMQRRS
jgi:hypothetical protein